MGAKAEAKHNHAFSLAAKDEPAPTKVEDNEKSQTPIIPPLAA